MSNDATQQLEAAEDAKAKQAATTVKYIFVGILFVINGFVADWFLGSESSVGDLSAMVGAFILGIRIFRTTIHDLRQGLLTTNELVAIAVLATFSSGEYHAAGLVAFFMLLGEMIESRTASGAKEAIRRLIKLTPTRAIRLIDGTEEEVAAVDLVVGDRIRVRPGDNVSADGEILLGTGSINQANITGESLPVDKKPGDNVFQGTINLDGMLEVEVTKVGEQTEFGRVRELILQAAQSKTQLMKIVDKYMGFYTPLVLVIGALVWAFTQDLNRVISVFIVSSPVAFILATPTAMVAAVATASRLGILIKQVSDIELAARINAFVFDKTGTITTGILTASRVVPVEGVQRSELLLATAAAEQYSNHPTAKAIGVLAAKVGLKLPEPKDFKEIAGKGVQATVDGAKIMVGREMWLNENEVTGDLKGSVDIDEAAGFSLVFVSRNGKFIGWVGMTDEIRPEAAEALEGLRNEGVRRLAIVSGDRIPVAERVAAEVGCEEVRAECLPGQKVEYIQDIRAKGYKVAFVGDGVNDAPALKAGDIGIAMGAAGSDVAIQSATIALMNNDLRRLPFLVHLSRMTRNVINQNFFFGILFVIIGLVLATLNYITPVLAALLNVLGSLIVVFNSARLVREGEEFVPFEEGGASGSEPQDSKTAPVEPELAVEVA